MSSVPSEVLRDVLLPLDRWTLDGVQFTDHRFLTLITERMSDVCLRQIHLASFGMPGNEESIGESWFIIRIDVSASREISRRHEDTARLFSEFMQALRSSRVAHLTLNDPVFTPTLAALIHETPVTVRELRLFAGSCAELTPAKFHEMVLHLSPTSLVMNSCRLRACQITDAFLRALNVSGLQRAFFQSLVPADGGSFDVTDDAVVDFCAQQEDAQIDQEGPRGSLRELLFSNGNFTKDLFKRLLEASCVSTRKQPLRVVVSPVPVEEEDLRDFAQHLSYRYRGTPRQLRIYDFQGEQHGSEAAMNLQIVLHPENVLEMLHARPPNIYRIFSN